MMSIMSKCQYLLIMSSMPSYVASHVFCSHDVQSLPCNYFGQMVQFLWPSHKIFGMD